ncbi:hypothetical protein BDZ85DRAFT_259852 [Elsinoe ampelina]|uniref:Uncharacterized protein n=1 Tax=Elsinoe ampelina TaxID=302913 RepID=A0A6A6GHN9_9PEZI|nr:hypothetical protein BDZ85DRAFT_259852 [Elsinoe ampelina]
MYCMSGVGLADDSAALSSFLPALLSAVQLQIALINQPLVYYNPALHQLSISLCLFVVELLISLHRRRRSCCTGSM